jgi:hypothetical protein
VSIFSIGPSAADIENKLKSEAKKARAALKRGQVKSSALMQEAEVVKQEAAGGMPWWGWAAIVGCGLALGIGGAILVRSRMRR